MNNDNKKDNITQAEIESMVGHPLRRAGDLKTNELSVTVGRLESSLESTNVALRDFASRTEHNIDRLTRSIEDLSKNQFMGKQTNWGMIASWAGVMVLLLGLVVYQPLQELRAGISTHKHDGHPHSVINKIEKTEESFNEVTSAIQREIQILEAADKARTESLTVWKSKIDELVLERQGTIAEFNTKIEALERDHSHMDREVDELSKQSTSYGERLLDVEREIYSGAAYRSGRPIKPNNGAN